MRACVGLFEYQSTVPMVSRPPCPPTQNNTNTTTHRGQLLLAASASSHPHPKQPQQQRFTPSPAVVRELQEAQRRARVEATRLRSVVQRLKAQVRFKRIVIGIWWGRGVWMPVVV